MKTLKYILILFIILLIPFSIYSVNKNNSLNGIVIVLDAGHGGFDKGASYQNVIEADLNLIITKKLEKKLTQLGSQVILTRNTNEDLSSSHSKKEDMKNRINIINDEKSDLFISIHMNIFQDSQVHGIHVFHQKNNNSIQLATILQNNINYNLNQTKEIKPGNFYILNNARIDGVLIECGFLSNELDRKQLLNEEYQNRIINCIVESIITYYQNQNII